MSSIAHCTLIPILKLNALRIAAVPKKSWFSRREKDTFYDFLDANGTPCLEFEGGGYYCVMALTWLEEKKNIDLMKSEHNDLAHFLSETREGACFILTKSVRDRYLEFISPDENSAQELTRYFEEFNEQEDPDSGQGIIDAIKWLKDCLDRINEGQVGILMIG